MQLMSLLKPGKRVSYFPWMEAPCYLMQFNSLPTEASSLQERFLFPVLLSRLFFKRSRATAAVSSPTDKYSAVVSAPGAVSSVQPRAPFSPHSSCHMEPCAFMLLQSNSCCLHLMNPPGDGKLCPPSSCRGLSLVLSAEPLPGVRSDSRSADGGL